MITAEEAWKESLSTMESVQTIDQLLEVDTKIKEYIKSPGCLGFITPPYHYPVAEKLCLELEEMGYNARTQASGRFTEAGEPLVSISVNWKYLPNGVSRAALTQLKNF